MIKSAPSVSLQKPRLFGRGEITTMIASPLKVRCKLYHHKNRMMDAFWFFQVLAILSEGVNLKASKLD
jgi:hypothetical protein